MILIGTSRHGDDDDGILLLETISADAERAPDNAWDKALTLTAQYLSKNSKAHNAYFNPENIDIIEEPTVNMCFDYLSDYNDEHVTNILAKCGLKHIHTNYCLTYTNGSDQPLDWL